MRQLPIWLSLLFLTNGLTAVFCFQKGFEFSNSPIGQAMVQAQKASQFFNNQDEKK